MQVVKELGFRVVSASIECGWKSACWRTMRIANVADASEIESERESEKESVGGKPVGQSVESLRPANRRITARPSKNTCFGGAEALSLIVQIV